ncbi:COG4648 family protein, partial [Vibrio parahaemolyticus]
AVGILLVALGMVFKQHGWLKFYPVVVNVCMLCVFAFSLKQPQSIIERLARLQEPELPPSGVAYTRKVTMVWCVFFVLNAAFALYTCFLPVKIWTLYNGLISYLLAGSLFAGEWIVRQFVRKEH